jgi:hypothetical protein
MVFATKDDLCWQPIYNGLVDIVVKYLVKHDFDCTLRDWQYLPTVFCTCKRWFGRSCLYG